MASAAVAAVIWLALSYRSERLQSEVERVTIKGEAITAVEAEEALRKVRDARAFQSDSGPKFLEWLLLHLRGRDRQADALAVEIVRDEPANAETWFVLAENASDPALAREARRRYAELRPPPTGDR
jgi:hypothetical protein